MFVIENKRYNKMIDLLRDNLTNPRVSLSKLLPDKMQIKGEETRTVSDSGVGPQNYRD